MMLKIPQLKDPMGTLSRWGAEIRKVFFITDKEYDQSAWQIWDPILTGSGGMTLSAIDVRVARYLVIGKLITFQLRVVFTTVGVGSTTISFTLPMASNKDDSGLTFACSITDTAIIAGSARATASAGSVFVRRYDGGNWAIGASREFRVTGQYDVG